MLISLFPDGFDEAMYVVSKLKQMPKLHRAVWRGDFIKVKSISNGIRKTVLNTRDKEHRLACINIRLSAPQNIFKYLIADVLYCKSYC